MKLTFGSNLFALQASQGLNDASASLGQIYERLSSGSRITRASDDAAGLAVADSLKADRIIRNQTLRNVNDAISFLNVAEAATSDLTTILTRQRELATQAANGTLSATERISLQDEFQALSSEYDRIVQSTEFNDAVLFLAGGNDTSFTAGSGTNSTIAISLGEELSQFVGDGSFGDQTELGADARDSAVGDFNGDGLEDIYLLTSSSGTSTLYLSNGDGTFSSSTLGFGDDETNVTEGDIDGDGDLDLVQLFNSSSDGAFVARVFINDGTGSFTGGDLFTTSISETNALRGFEAADLDGDGDDEFIASFTTDGAQLLSFDGVDEINGTSALGPGGDTFTVADFNNDGLLDIAAQSISALNTEVYFNQGGLSFSLGSTISGTNPLVFDSGDINQDGNIDIVSGAADGTIEIRLGNGDGTFTEAADLSDLGLLRDVVIADLNSDGYLDLMSRAITGGTVSTRLGNNDGTFQAAQTTNVGDSGFNGVTLADVTGDGELDYIAAVTSGALTILEQNTEQSLSIGQFSLATQDAALIAIEETDASLERVSNELGVLGATSSRLASTSAVTATESEKLATAESQIRDVDVADESAALIAAQIRQEAASAVLAQANSLPEFLLSLLED